MAVITTGPQHYPPRRPNRYDSDRIPFRAENLTNMARTDVLRNMDNSRILYAMGDNELDP